MASDKLKEYASVLAKGTNYNRATEMVNLEVANIESIQSLLDALKQRQLLMKLIERNDNFDRVSIWMPSTEDETNKFIPNIADYTVIERDNDRLRTIIDKLLYCIRLLKSTDKTMNGNVRTRIKCLENSIKDREKDIERFTEVNDLLKELGEALKADAGEDKIKVITEKLEQKQRNNNAQTPLSYDEGMGNRADNNYNSSPPPCDDYNEIMAITNSVLSTHGVAMIATRIFPPSYEDSQKHYVVL